MDKNYTLHIETHIHVLKARTIRIWIYFTCFSEIDLRLHLRTALSNSWGRLVAPIINTLSSPLPAIPDTYVHKQETWSFLSLSIYVLPVLSFLGFFFYFSLILTPSKCTRNSVFSLRLASFSPSLRSHKSESISSAMEQKIHMCLFQNIFACFQALDGIVIITVMLSWGGGGGTYPWTQLMAGALEQ